MLERYRFKHKLNLLAQAIHSSLTGSKRGHGLNVFKVIVSAHASAYLNKGTYRQDVECTVRGHSVCVEDILIKGKVRCEWAFGMMYFICFVKILLCYAVVKKRNEITENFINLFKDVRIRRSSCLVVFGGVHNVNFFSRMSQQKLK